MPKIAGTLDSIVPYGIYRYTLPFPPSVNHYWRTARVHGKQRTYISKEGIAFCKAVAKCVQQRPNTRRRLAVTLLLQRADNTEYDVDNYCKATWDALSKAGVFQNDNQIDDLRVKRLPPAKGKGKAFVTIAEVGPAKTKLSVR